MALVYFFFLSLILSAKADGRFPFGSLSGSGYGLVVTIYTMLFVLFICLYVKYPDSHLKGIKYKYQALLFLAVNELIAVLIFILSQKKYADFGYVLPGISLIIYGAVVMGVLCSIAVTRHLTPKMLLLSGIVLWIGGQALEIINFPLNSERSDMLPLIEDACHAFIKGVDPYSDDNSGRTVPLTYLPPLWMAYLPSIALSIDIRWMNVLYLPLALVFLYKAGVDKWRSAFLCIIYITIPYLQYRHEIYLAPILFVFSLFVYCFSRGKHYLSSLLFGMVSAMTQLVWVALPVYVFYLIKHESPRRKSLSIALPILVPLILSGFFISYEVAQNKILYEWPLDVPSAWNTIIDTRFVKGVFLYWREVVNLEAMNFGILPYYLLGKKGLLLLQLAAVCMVYYYGLKKITAHESFYMLVMAFAIFAFVLFNALVWSYFYLLVLFVFLSYGCLLGSNYEKTRL